MEFIFPYAVVFENEGRDENSLCGRIILYSTRKDGERCIWLLLKIGYSERWPKTCMHKLVIENA